LERSKAASFGNRPALGFVPEPSLRDAIAIRRQSRAARTGSPGRTRGGVERAPFIAHSPHSRRFAFGRPGREHPLQTRRQAVLGAASLALCAMNGGQGMAASGDALTFASGGHTVAVERFGAAGGKRPAVLLLPTAPTA